MFSFLKNHPFAVEAFFESSLVLTFAIPKGKIQHLIPECLELDTFNDKILANMPSGIAFIDPNSRRFLQANDAFAHMARRCIVIA